MIISISPNPKKSDFLSEKTHQNLRISFNKNQFPNGILLEKPRVEMNECASAKKKLFEMKYGVAQ